jgi:ATP/maltotriose-dependent transcriptional regulator MalT
MLDTVRHYAVGQLAATNEEAGLQRRHAQYYAAQATPAEDDVFSEERAEHYRKLAAEGANLRAGLEWALESGEADFLLRMTADLCLYWFVRNRFDETLYWLPRALEVSSSEPTPQRATVLYMLGFQYAYNRREEARALARELASVADVLGDPERAADAIWIHGISAELDGDLEEARRLAEEQVRLLRGVDHPATSLPLLVAAVLSLLLGDAAAASHLVDEAEDRAVRFSQTQILAQVLGMRGFIAHHRGDLPGAERLLSQAIGELRRLGWIPVQTEYLAELATVATAMGKLEQAELWARDLGELVEGPPPDYNLQVVRRTVLARIALLRDEIGAARALIDDALQIAVDSEDRLGMALVLAVAAQMNWAAGDPERATVLHAGATRLRQTIGYVPPAPRARELEQENTDIRSSLEQAAYEAARAKGESMSQGELVEYAKETLARQ